MFAKQWKAKKTVTEATKMKRLKDIMVETALWHSGFFQTHLYLCQYSKSLRELREAMMILPDNFVSSASSAIVGKNGSSLYTSAPYLNIVKITFSLHCCLSIKDDNEV